MTKPKMIGSIGQYIKSNAKLGRKSFSFNGTTLDLVRRAYHLGAIPCDKIKADFGGGFRNYIVYAAPHDDRAFGLWVA